MIDPNAVAILTTPERVDYFRAAAGEGADCYFDLERTEPLPLFLSNLALSGCQVVVLDEDHFISVDRLAAGLQAYVDEPQYAYSQMRIVVVCSDREPGDEFLAFLATYCDLYDIVWQAQGPEIANELGSLIRYPNRRVDVLPLMTKPFQGEAEERPRPTVGEARTFNVTIQVSVEPGEAGGMRGGIAKTVVI